MSKPHSSLSPTTNIVLVFAWAAGAAVFLFVVQPQAPTPLAVTGIILGVISGVMQHLSIMQAIQGFSSAASFLEVRSALKATSWGTRYIRFLYFSKFILLVLCFLLVREPLLAVIYGYLAGYFSLMFAREIVTLRDTFLLHRLSDNAPDQ